MKIFWITGEKSGDNIGSMAAKELKKRDHKIQMQGIIGTKMKSLGIEEIFPMKSISVMGLFEIFKHLPEILKIRNKIVEKIIQEMPDIVISIDSYFFCKSVISKARKILKKRKIQNKVKFLHIVAPKVWAYLPRRAKTASKLFDKLLCILPFEPEYFTKYNLDTTFIGTPVVGYSKGFRSFAPETKENGIFYVAITIGSRLSEINRHLFIIRELVDKLSKKNQNIRYIILTTEHTSGIVMSEFATLTNRTVTIISNEEEKQQALKYCNFAIAKSGTNNLELTIAGIPILSYYKVHPLTAMLAKIFLKIKYMNLINIIADKEIITEFKQNDINTDKMSNLVLEYLNNPHLCDRQIKEAQKVLDFMKNPKGIKIEEDIVNNILNLIERK